LQATVTTSSVFWSFSFYYQSMSFIMSDYVNPSEACFKSKELLLYATVITVRDGPCTLLNPSYIESPVKLSEHSRIRTPVRKEIIEVDESPIASKPNPPAQTIPPAQRRGLATQVPTSHTSSSAMLKRSASTLTDASLKGRLKQASFLLFQSFTSPSESRTRTMMA
jgi:hypothetical protein